MIWYINFIVVNSGMAATFFVSVIVISFFDIGVEYFVNSQIRVYPIMSIVFSLLGMFL